MIVVIEEGSLRQEAVRALRARAAFDLENGLMVVDVTCVVCGGGFFEALRAAIDDVIRCDWHLCIRCDPASLM